ncbi:unnamed protein product [Dibothriocephalus latus]|uniref:Uncharacterized protein n=1 Tax=Dibothriocephalus latus TaxID=60516 RepID=A0A3P6TGQ4_DIBLA|nr:unnamed protein product [Dibothriocephalus latus]
MIVVEAKEVVQEGLGYKTPILNSFRYACTGNHDSAHESVSTEMSGISVITTTRQTQLLHPLAPLLPPLTQLSQRPRRTSSPSVLTFLKLCHRHLHHPEDDGEQP